MFYCNLIPWFCQKKKKIYNNNKNTQVFLETPTKPLAKNEFSDMQKEYNYI